MRPSLAAAALVVALSCPATAQVAILQIQVLEGEGGVYAPGARVPRPLVVQITDETGSPVPGAAVSFHLPEEGAGGNFVNGLRTVVTTTDERGRAALRNLVLNRVPGRFPIRIIASKEQARAGMISFQYIAGPATGIAPAGKAPPPRAARSRAKWIALTALVAGAGTAAGLALTQPSATAPASSAPPLVIGTPSFSVGKP